MGLDGGLFKCLLGVSSVSEVLYQTRPLEVETGWMKSTFVTDGSRIGWHLFQGPASHVSMEKAF